MVRLFTSYDSVYSSAPTNRILLHPWETALNEYGTVDRCRLYMYYCGWVEVIFLIFICYIGGSSIAERRSYWGVVFHFFCLDGTLSFLILVSINEALGTRTL